jgi:hypothetical protein
MEISVNQLRHHGNRQDSFRQGKDGNQKFTYILTFKPYKIVFTDGATLFMIEN